MQISKFSAFLNYTLISVNEVSMNQNSWVHIQPFQLKHILFLVKTRSSKYFKPHFHEMEESRIIA